MPIRPADSRVTPAPADVAHDVPHGQAPAPSMPIEGPLPPPKPSLRPVTSPAPPPPGSAPTLRPRNESGFREAMRTYEAARAKFIADAETYWDNINAVRRKRVDRSAAELTDRDFISADPPVAPTRPNPVEFGLPADFERPPEEPSTIPRVPVFLAAAQSRGYRFDVSPREGTAEARATFETNFRERYVRLSRDAGLSREQVLGVYSFETGGRGLHDLQSGLDANGDGRPASTALGYAQLLAAKSIDVMANRGTVIADRLDGEGQHGKAELVRRMSREVRAVHDGAPNWSQAQAMARTDLGRAVHAANLDLYIGPHLQVTKLEDTLAAYRRLASANDMPADPTPATLESLNLAGDQNGFFMAHPLLAQRTTPNFFDGAGYAANPITRLTQDGVILRPRTAGELQIRMAEIMAGPNSQAPGTIELGQIWDRLPHVARP